MLLKTVQCSVHFNDLVSNTTRLITKFADFKKGPQGFFLSITKLYVFETGSEVFRYTICSEELCQKGSFLKRNKLLRRCLR